MKKLSIAAALLSAVIAFSFAGCAKKESETSDTKENSSASETTETEASVTETSESALDNSDDEYIGKYSAFAVTSDSLHDGYWDDVTSNVGDYKSASPQLSWDPVDGASCYVIYMVDLSASNFLHWKQGDITETNLSEGFAERKYYVGPYPPQGAAHRYTIYVIALKNPVEKVQGSLRQGALDLANYILALDTDKDGNTGNILAAGKISGKYETGRTAGETKEPTTVETEAPITVEWDIKSEISEPVINDLTETEKVVTFVRDGKKIDGRLYLPEGEGPFPVVIFSCGLLEPYTDYISRAKRFAQNGYAVVLYDFTQNVDGTFLSKITVQDDKFFEFETQAKADEAQGSFFHDGAKELYAVMDSLSYLPKVDTKSVYLAGHSVGGEIASYVGTIRQDEIKGMFLVEPAIAYEEHLYVQADPLVIVNTHEVIAGCKAHTLIYVGTHDGYGDNPRVYDKALELMSASELVIIDGADHSFIGEYGDKMVDDACERAKNW